MTTRSLFYRILIVVPFVLLIGYWISKIIQDEMPYVDRWGQALTDKTSNTVFYVIARWITELGSGSFLIPFTIICMIGLWWLYKDWLPSIFFGGGTLSSHLLNKWIKHLVERERPSIFVEANAVGYSFPSGHAMISMVCYGLLLFFLIKKIPSIKLHLQLFIPILIFFIGMSRVIIDVHYLTDVLIGFTFGFFLVVCYIYLFQLLQEYKLHRS